MSVTLCVMLNFSCTQENRITLQYLKMFFKLNKKNVERIITEALERN